MIYDCFSFFNELDLLEIRLNTLDKVVDRFVLSESNYTHTGTPKPLYFKENESRFKKFSDRIIHVISPNPADPTRAGSDVAYSWLCENAQRNATIRAIEPQLKDDDILIVSDLDEIPDPAAIGNAIKMKKPVRLRQKFYYYFLNYRCCTTPFWDSGSVVISYGDFRNPETYRRLATGEWLNQQANTLPTATKVRFLRGIKSVRNGGWHFSYIGGIEKVMKKINSTADGYQAQMRDPSSIQECISSGNDINGRGEWFFAEKFDINGFPSAALKFPELAFKTSSTYFRKVRIKRLLAYAKWIVRPLAWKLIPHPLAVWLSRKTSRI